MIPIWAAVLGLAVILIPVALLSYWFGFRWREKTGPVYTVRKTKNMTPEQEKHFDETFAHMGKAFESMRKGFGRDS